MRELKFRAWSEETESFEFFDLYEATECGLTNLQIWARNAQIEQYTGLKDKNGKEIYEGDIVRYAFDHPEGERVEEVSFGKISDGEGYYHDYFLAWRTVDSDGDEAQSLLDLEGECEIIGNIHENSELLEGKK